MTTQTIYRLNKRDSERVLAWARYVFWANVEREQYDAYEPPEDEPPTGRRFALMAQWYAALWVAIEGWRESSLSDPIVDELLTELDFKPNLQRLRRFRNGVYHYQETLLDDRLLGFLREGTNTAPWAFLVHSEFKRVLWELAHPQTIPLGLQGELADGIRHIVGWLPGDIPEASAHDAALRYREVAAMILKDDRRDTPEGKELMAAVAQLRLAANEAQTEWSRCKRAMIDCLKGRGRNE